MTYIPGSEVAIRCLKLVTVVWTLFMYTAASTDTAGRVTGEILCVKAAILEFRRLDDLKKTG